MGSENVIRTLRPCFAIAVAWCGISVATACNIPVFRYALERWKPDSWVLIVFHDQQFSAEQEQVIQRLRDRSDPEESSANIDLHVVDVVADADDPRISLWQQIRERADADQASAGTSDSERQTAGLPHVLVRTKLGRGQWINHWRGPLTKDLTKQILDSPVRVELRDRLLKGDSIVWLMLRSTDETRNEAVRRRIADRSTALAKTIQLPEGIGLPGSELYAEVPLVLKFSLLEIDPADPKEAFLVGLLSGFDPQAHAAGDPLLVPVFGRGRALEVIPATTLSDPLIDDLTMYLSAACSCQVKEQNPGFDLLIHADWESELFGTEGDRPPDRSGEEGLNRPPVNLTIPPGRSR